MITTKSISKEVLANCKRIRPNEFKDVTPHDVEMIMNIIWRNIVCVLKEGSLLALKDFMLMRPNLKKKIRQYKSMRRKKYFLGINLMITDLENKGVIGQMEKPYIPTDNNLDNGHF